MVMGSFFCICLERPKYFYIAVDKATYLKNELCPSFPTGKTMCHVCVSMYSGVLKQVSHYGDGHSPESRGAGSGGKCLPCKGLRVGALILDLPPEFLGCKPGRIG
jgi:hypothetical protein